MQKVAEMASPNNTNLQNTTAASNQTNAPNSTNGTSTAPPVPTNRSNDTSEFRCSAAPSGLAFKKGHTCNETCRYLNHSLVFQQPYRKGLLQGALVNDAFGFNKQLEQIIFTNFMLADKFVDISLKKEYDGVLSLANTKNSIVYTLNYDNITLQPIFSLQIKSINGNLTSASLIIGGLIEEDQVNQMSYLPACNISNQWGLAYSEILLESGGLNGTSALRGAAVFDLENFGWKLSPALYELYMGRL